MSETRHETAEAELNKIDRQARKMLRAARKGGKESAGLAEAGAMLLSDVMQQRVRLAKEAFYWNILDDVLRQVGPLLAQASGRKPGPDVATPHASAVPKVPAFDAFDEANLPRDLQLHCEIQRLAAERAGAEPGRKAEIEGKLTQLRQEYLAFTRAKAAPLLNNYRAQVFCAAGQRLAGVLLDLELNEGPKDELESKRDRLGEVLQHLTEEDAVNQLEAALSRTAAAVNRRVAVVGHGSGE